MRHLWPDAAERKILGRFYVAGLSAEALNVIPPFEFLFLFLVMDRPEWAVVPLLCEQVAIFLMEVPTGAIADRFGRKASVLAGDVVSAIAFLLVPFATTVHGPAQIVLVSGAFLLEGVGQTLVSGAEEAWVVDTLLARDREDLVDRFFGRMRSFGSAGGVVAGVLAFVLLERSGSSRAALDLLWFLAAGGHLVSVLVLWPVPDAAAQDDPDERDALSDAPIVRRTVGGLLAIGRRGPLFAIFLVGVVWALATSVTGDVLDLGLVGRGFDATYFALLGVARDLVGMLAPLLGVALGRRLGFRRTLLLLVVAPIAAASLFFTRPGLASLVALFLLFGLIYDLWIPVAEARLQATTPSWVRATVGSLANQGRRLASLVGLAAFTWVLGRQGATLREALPGLEQVFSGAAPGPMPPGPFGFPLPDLLLVSFSLVGLAAVPLLLVRAWNGPVGRKGEKNRDRSPAVIDPELDLPLAGA